MMKGFLLFCGLIAIYELGGCVESIYMTAEFYMLFPELDIYLPILICAGCLSYMGR